MERNISDTLNRTKQGGLDEHLKVLVRIGLLRIKLVVFVVFKRYVDRAAHGRIDDEDHLFVIIR